MINRMLDIDDATSGRSAPTTFVNDRIAGAISINVYTEVCEFQPSEVLIETQIMSFSE